MKKIFTPLCVFLLSVTSSIFGQSTMLNNFETVSPTVVSRYGLTSTFSIVPNPKPTGNTTASCGRIGRTTSNWYELIGFNTSFSVPANTTRFLHVLVNYEAQPDITVRVDAANAAADGATDIRPLNTYTNLGNWQDMVFQINGGTAGITVNAIIFLPDLGFNNTPKGLILNNTDRFGLVDEFLVNDSATPITLSVDSFEKNNDIAIYPNPTSELLTVTNLQTDSVVTINSLDGKNIYTSTNHTTGSLNVSVKEWAKGIYIMNIQNDNGNVVKKFIVQ